jgi:hypothetical protein
MVPRDRQGARLVTSLKSGPSANHPPAVMSGIGARSPKLPGSFTGHFASGGHSEADPIAAVSMIG